MLMVTPRKLTISYEVESMKHHTKDKGDLGVLKAQVDLYEKGSL
jgi:hypothetical protein